MYIRSFMRKNSPNTLLTPVTQNYLANNVILIVDLNAQFESR